MKRWQRWTRLGVVAVAGFFLLVTGPTQAASGAALSTSGTLTGTVTVTGAPQGFTPGFLGAGACPSTTPPGQVCANPVYALATGGTYTLSLAAGSWEIDGFYEVNGFGGVFLGPPQLVTIPAGGTVTQNLTVAYSAPATIRGTINVTRVPSGIQVQSLTVLLCPSFAPYDGVNPSIACVRGYGQQPLPGGTSAPFQVTGLPPGGWTAYPGYCTNFGCAINAKAGKAVTLVAGGTTRARLTTPFILPGDGLLTGTVTVTGAPTGFADPVSVSACMVGGGNCQTFFGFGGNSFTMLLANGQWNVNGLYLVPPFNNAITGPTQTVTIAGGQTTTLALTVPYQLLGTAAGTIHVTGRHGPITSYTVLACPSSSPWTGGFTPQGCVSEFSGPGGYGFGAAAAPLRASTGAAAPRTPFNLYQLPTLTPGSWILYPGYRTAFGSYTDPSGTTVAITAGQTTTQHLSVAYQVPTVGIVVGKVNVIGAPTNGSFQSGARACSAPPTGTSCPGEQYAYNQSTNAYQLTLSPGTWWVSGFVDVYSIGPGVRETTSQPVVVTVTAGSRSVANFTVTAS